MYRSFPAFSQIQDKCLEKYRLAKVCLKTSHLWYYLVVPLILPSTALAFPNSISYIILLTVIAFKKILMYSPRR